MRMCVCVCGSVRVCACRILRARLCVYVGVCVRACRIVRARARVGTCVCVRTCSTCLTSSYRINHESIYACFKNALALKEWRLIKLIVI